MYLTVVHAQPSPEVVPGAMVLGVLTDPTIPWGTILRSLTTMNSVDRDFYRCLVLKSLDRSPGFALLDQRPCHFQECPDAWNC